MKNVSERLSDALKHSLCLDRAVFLRRIPLLSQLLNPLLRRQSGDPLATVLWRRTCLIGELLNPLLRRECGSWLSPIRGKRFRRWN
jgi:hypothetical protein